MSPSRLLLAAAGLVVAGDLAAHAALALTAARARPRCPQGDESAPRLARAARVVGEAALTLLAVLALPLALRRTEARFPAAREATPTLLVHAHGVGGLARLGLWRQLRRGGRQVHALGYGVPVHIERAAGRLERALARLRRATGAAAVDVVAHGAGGLIARAYIRSRGPAAGVRRLVTLASPHRGPASALLADDPVPALVDVTAIYSPDDAVVPAARAYYPGAFNVEVDGIGHLAMLVSRRIAALVHENLDAPGALPPAAGGMSDHA